MSDGKGDSQKLNSGEPLIQKNRLTGGSDEGNTSVTVIAEKSAISGQKDFGQ